MVQYFLRAVFDICQGSFRPFLRRPARIYYRWPRLSLSLVQLYLDTNMKRDREYIHLFIPRYLSRPQISRFGLHCFQNDTSNHMLYSASFPDFFK